MASQYNSRRSVHSRPPAAPSRRWSTIGQPSGKANYRPMTSMSRRPSRLQQRPAGEDSKAEGNIPTERNIPTETTPKENKQRPRITNQPFPSEKRYSYRQPSDPKVAFEMGVLTKYVKDKNLMASMMTCCQSVLQQDSLPYNPYPEFVSMTRRDAERFHMFAKTAKAIQTDLTSQLQPTTTPHIYGVKGYSSAWGLEAVIHAVSTQALKQYDWLVEDVSPTKIVLSDEQHEYSGQILVAIVGPAAFSGTMYREAPSIDLRMEYVIYGPDLQMALLIFNNCISEDIRLHVSGVSPHRVLGILVPGSQPSEPVVDNDGAKLWTIEQARGQWDAFWDLVRDAVVRKHPITLLCVFLLDKENNVYRIGKKQFILHFVQMSEDSRKEKFTSFAQLPYLTLYEGIFLKKAHAEAYVMTLRRHHETASESATRGFQENSRRQSMEDSLVSLREKERDDSMDDLVHSDAVRDPIKKSWQRQMAKLHPVREAFKLTHLTLLLALSDRSAESTEVKTELYRFLHSTAAAWHVATVLNSNLQLLAVTTPTESDDIQGILTHYSLEYKKKLLAAIDPELHARSSELHIAHAVLGKLVQHTLVPDPADPNVLKSVDLNGLRQVQDYCTTLQLLLMEDAMFFFKLLNFKTLVIRCRQAFNTMTVKSTEARKKKVQPTKSTKSTTTVTGHAANPIKTSHGTESKEITQQKNIVIDLEEVKASSNWPRIMVTEAVLMQYMVDVKLDLVWHEYLQELLMGDRLPPNPYPRLVTVLRQAAHRMQLCSETNSALSSKLLRPEQTRLLDRAHTVHGVTSVGAFGLSHRTLAGVDADPWAFVKVAKLMDPLTNREVAARRGQFQIEVGQAVGQSCALYGRLVPYLNILHLYDHYYIRGNIAADSDAIQLYARLVYDYISNLSTKNCYVVLGVYFDGSGRYMSEADLETDKATFFSHVVDAARKKHDIYLKMFQPVGWRYLCMHKHFVLHYLFVDNTEDRHECYSPEGPSTIYHYVFLSQEEAAAHCRGSGVKQLGNIEGTPRMRSVNDCLTKQVEGALAEHRVTWAYELVLRKALINKDTKRVADAWRVLHSPAFQLEYIQTINKDLQTLVHYAVTFPKKLIKAAPSNQSLSKGRANKAKTEKDLINQSQGPLSDTTLAKFIGVYTDKLSSILREPCAFVPSSLLELIQKKLKTVIDVDDQTQKQSLLIEPKTATTLKEIHQLVQPVQDWTSYDVHKAVSHHGNSYIAPQA